MFLGAFCAKAQIFVPEPVQWQDHVKTGGTYPGPQGSILTRTGATSATPGWDGDAISTKWIYGDGWVEFRFDQTTGKSIALGLVVTNANRHWDTLDYCFKLAGGTVGAFQSGVQLWSTSSFLSSDVFRIERTGTKIFYKRNGVTVAQSGNSYESNQGPLFVDTSFVHVNGSISNCRYYGASGPEDVAWLERNSFMDGSYPNGGTGSRITKTSNTDLWDNDAVSTSTINGDGELRFRINISYDRLAIGLTESDPDANYTSLTYAVFVDNYTAANKLYVYELGVLKHTAPASFYNLFDVFSIRRVGSQVEYLKNGIPFYTSERLSSAPLFVDCSIKSQSAKFEGCQILGTQLAQPAVAYAVSGSVQHKPAPTGTDASNSSAASAACFYTQTIDANGSIHFAFAQSSGKNAAAGLSTKGTLAFTPQSMNYAVLGRSDGQIEIFESGTSRGLFSSYTNTDRFEVRRINGMIEYYRNGMLLRSVSSSNGALAGAVVMNEQNAGVNDIHVYNGRKPIEWRRYNRTTADWSFANGSSLTRDGSAAAWNGDALGSRQLVGDGYIQCTGLFNTQSKAFGLSPSDKGNNLDDLQWAFHFAAGTLKVREAGVEKGNFGTYLQTDVFRIRRVGSTIKYFKLNADGSEPAIPLYTSTAPATSPLVVDCSIYTPNATLSGAEISFDDSDSDGLSDEWELGEFGSLAQTGTGDADADGVDNVHEMYNGTIADNHAPTVGLSIQSIVPLAPATLKLVASPADVDGNLLRVDFYENSQFLGTVNSAPWEFTISGRPAGSYTYQASAVDAENVTGSASQSVTVYSPTLSKVAGDNQTSATNVFLTSALVVDIRAGVGGSIIAGHQVTFTVINGNGGLSTTSGGATNNSVTLASNASGQATVYFKQPTSPNYQSQIQVTAPGATAVTFTATTTTVVGNALVGHWQLNETSGTAISDASGSNNPGLIDAPPHAFFTKGYNWTAGPQVGGLGIQPNFYTGQRGLSIDNTDYRVLPATGQPFSITMWFRTNDLAAGNLFNVFCNETYLESGLRIGIDTGQYYTFGTPALMVWSHQSGGNMFTRFSTALSAHRWYHLAVTYSGTTAKIYVDGTLLGTQTASIVSNTNLLRFGSGIGGCRNLDGVIDDARVYQKELTGTEIITIRNSVTDGDSLDDTWERQNFGDLSYAPTDDPDSDGLNNLGEYNAGTKPKVPDTDGDGMPDGWEVTYNLNPNDPNDATLDADSDGNSNYQEYQQGTDPRNPASRILPAIGIFDGNNQITAPSKWLPLPMMVKVTNSIGAALLNVPVTFQGTSGGGSLRRSLSDTTSNSTLTVFTDADGYAGVFYVQPATLNTTSTVSATITSGADTSSAIFTSKTVAALLTNDQFENAQLLSGTSGSLDSTNAGATVQQNEPTFLPLTPSQNAEGGYIVPQTGATVWFKWQAPDTARYRFQTGSWVKADGTYFGNGTDFDTVLAVYQGGTLTTLNLIGGNDDTDTVASAYEFNVVQGQFYYIVVDGIEGQAGKFFLSWYPVGPVPPGTAPSNDAFLTAENITGLDGTLSGSNVDATKESGEPNHQYHEGSKSVWYRWQAPESATVVFDTVNSDFNTILGVYQGPNVASLQEIAWNDDADDLRARLSFEATAGQIYHIMVDGFGTESGQVSLNWQTLSPAPANDLFAAATLLSGGSGSASGRIRGATAEFGEPIHAGNGPAKSVWYKWSTSETANFIFQVDGIQFGAALAIYTGTSVAGLTEVASTAGWPGAPTTLWFNPVPGTLYYIAVDIVNDTPPVEQAMSFTLTWEQTPASQAQAQSSMSSATIPVTFEEALRAQEREKYRRKMVARTSGLATAATEEEECEDPAEPNKGDAFAPDPVIVLIAPRQDLPPVASCPVEFSVGHSIVTTNTPRARDLHGQLRLTIEGDSSLISLSATQKAVTEPGHEGCDVHDWHTGTETFEVTALKKGNVTIRAEVDPDPETPEGDGAPRTTATINVQIVEVSDIVIYHPSTSSEADWQSSNKVLKWHEVIDKNQPLKLKLILSSAIPEEETLDLCSLKFAVFKYDDNPNQLTWIDASNATQQVSPSRSEVWVTVDAATVAAALEPINNSEAEFATIEGVGSESFADSLAFEAGAKLLPSSKFLVPARDQGNETDQPKQVGSTTIPPFTAMASGDYPKFGGAVYIQAKAMNTLSKRRLYRNQADYLYISGHGSSQDGSVAGLTPGRADWKEDLDVVIIAGCSVLDINDYNGNYDDDKNGTLEAGPTAKVFPGELWAKTGPRILLGYNYKAPLDGQGAPGIISTWWANRAKGEIEAWRIANDNKAGRNACAIDTVNGNYYYFKRTPGLIFNSYKWTVVPRSQW